MWILEIPDEQKTNVQYWTLVKIFTDLRGWFLTLGGQLYLKACLLQTSTEFISIYHTKHLSATYYEDTVIRAMREVNKYAIG